jgi:hypothetical protein
MIASQAGGTASSMPMTIWTSSLVGAGLTQYAVPAGRNLRILNMQAAWNSSAVTGGSVNVMVLYAGASASFSSGALISLPRPLMLAGVVSAGVTQNQIQGFGDIPSGQTIAVFQTAATAMNWAYVIVNGYLF